MWMVWVWKFLYFFVKFGLDSRPFDEFWRHSRGSGDNSRLARGLQEFMSIRNPINSLYVPLIPIRNSYDQLRTVLNSYWLQSIPVMTSYDQL